jgi:hypothetical protein
MTKKNFETLEDGCWYQSRGGGLYQVTYSPGAGGWYNRHGDETWTKYGEWCPGSTDHRDDLISKVTPPVFELLSQKKKRTVRLYKWLYPTQQDHKDLPGFHENPEVRGTWSMASYTDAPRIGTPIFIGAVRVDSVFIDVEVEE